MAFHIMGTGSCLPSHQVTNDELSEFLDTDDEWISTRTGIHSRPVCTRESLDQLAQTAALRALQAAGVDAADLDYVICTTCSSERCTPSQACVVQGAIGADCPAFDVNGACAGFIYALDIADGLLSRGGAGRVLVVSAEKMSRLCDWGDRATCVLFGDGAAAAVLGASGDSPLYLNLTSEPDDRALYAWTSAGNSPFDQAVRPIAEQEGPFLHMRGREVFKFAVTHIERELRQMEEKSGVPLSQVDHFVFHQANKRIIDAGVERLGLDPERVAVTIDHTANVSSACIPLTLDRLASADKLLPGQLVAMFGFGSGLVTGTCLLRWGPSGARAE